ncbi:hypothetical protein JL2886_01319 [Phaeobacter gallaeciensis]|uniref:Uncharacterized protein n=1 Tax=Phaeobacter gallaeciensis TaxID=60890 RepID=A0A1B0ZPZ7_9RHOB|nr:hypothetical protein JL2886_01319 [Phaeobacter gallaeciensis]
MHRGVARAKSVQVILHALSSTISALDKSTYILGRLCVNYYMYTYFNS